MATAGQNAATPPMGVNPFGGNEPPASTCLDDPNFATICSFIQNFGEIIRIGRIPFDELQQMLENTADAVALPLVQLHLTLLRRVYKSVTTDKWERSLAKFGHSYCSQDAWEIERFGYKKAKIQTKLRLLKNLLEAQFDYNVKFKAEVNKLQAADLRLTPLGRDTEGQLYWYQVDEDANLRVYREDIDDETWEIVASSRDELEELINQLQRGEVKKPEPEENIILAEEDSNSKDDIEPKEIILDTGKVEDDFSNDVSNDSEEMEEVKHEHKTVEPLIIKHNFSFNKSSSGEVTSNDVKYEVSECEPNAPGIKLVFGLKSRPKPETSKVKSQEIKKVEESDEAKLKDNSSKNQDKIVEIPTPVTVSKEIVAEPKPITSTELKEPKTTQEIVAEPTKSPAKPPAVVKECLDLQKEVKPRETDNVLVQPVLTEAKVSTSEPADLVKVQSESSKNLHDTLTKELSTKVGRREQTKSSKNLQKSAKVNSIADRLNKILPDKSIKSVADLLPPPDNKQVEAEPKQRVRAKPTQFSIHTVDSFCTSSVKPQTPSSETVDAQITQRVSEQAVITSPVKEMQPTNEPVDLQVTSRHESSISIKLVETSLKKSVTSDGPLKKDCELKAVTSKPDSVERNVKRKEKIRDIAERVGERDAKIPRIYDTEISTDTSIISKQTTVPGEKIEGAVVTDEIKKEAKEKPTAAWEISPVSVKNLENRGGTPVACVEPPTVPTEALVTPMGISSAPVEVSAIVTSIAPVQIPLQDKMAVAHAAIPVQPVITPVETPVSPVETPPVASVETPPVASVETAPVASVETTPVASVKTPPVALVETPVVLVETPVALVETQVVPAEMQAAPSEAPNAQVQMPVTHVEASVAHVEAQVASVYTPAVPVQISAASAEKPEPPVEIPVASVEIPKAPVETPVAPADIPVTPVVKPVAPAEVSVAPVEVPLAPAEISGAPAVIPVAPAVIPVAPAVIPVAPAEIPVAPAEIPVAPAEIPVPPAEIPVASAEIPVASAEIPVASAEIPVASAEIPVASAEIPVASAEIRVAPAEKPVVSLETPDVALETPVSPVDTSVAHTDTSVAPTDTSVAPTNTSVVPTNTSVAPTNTSVVPTNASVAPQEIPVVVEELPIMSAEKSKAPEETPVAPEQNTTVPQDTLLSPSTTSEAVLGKPVDMPVASVEVSLDAAESEDSKVPTAHVEVSSEQIETRVPGSMTESTKIPPIMAKALELPSTPSQEPVILSDKPEIPVEMSVEAAEDLVAPTETVAATNIPYHPIEEKVIPAKSSDLTASSEIPTQEKTEITNRTSFNNQDLPIEDTITSLEQQIIPVEPVKSPTRDQIPSYIEPTKHDLRTDDVTQQVNFVATCESKDRAEEQPEAFEAVKVVSESTLVSNDPTILKDSKDEPVPMDLDESDSLTIDESVIQKTEAWVCGNEEPLVVKSTTWVCGDAVAAQQKASVNDEPESVVNTVDNDNVLKMKESSSKDNVVKEELIEKNDDNLSQQVNHVSSDRRDADSNTTSVSPENLSEDNVKIQPEASVKTDKPGTVDEILMVKSDVLDKTVVTSKEIEDVPSSDSKQPSISAPKDIGFEHTSLSAIPGPAALDVGTVLEQSLQGGIQKPEEITQEKPVEEQAAETTVNEIVSNDSNIETASKNPILESIATMDGSVDAACNVTSTDSKNGKESVHTEDSRAATSSTPVLETKSSPDIDTATKTTKIGQTDAKTKHASPSKLTSVPAIKSSLVLYSESSDSSNDGFPDDTKMSKSGDVTTQESSRLSTNSSEEKAADLGNNENGSETNSIPVPIAGDLLTSTDHKTTDNVQANSVMLENAGTKRKAAEDVESLAKVRKVEDSELIHQDQAANGTSGVTKESIVGEAVEENVMIISGEGSGAMNESPNSPTPFNPICGETIEEEIVMFFGEGSGALNEGSNENSPASLLAPDGSQNDSNESDDDDSQDAFPAKRGRGGGRRGRGRRGRPSGGRGARSSGTPSSTPRNNNRGSRGSREMASLGVSAESLEVNGDSERPVRASRRIAQIRLKEEEERRQLEEERLAQLKAAQMRKKAKQEEKEKSSSGTPVKKGVGRKSQQNLIVAEYVPSGSESEERSDEDEGSDEFSGKVGKGGKRGRRRKNGKAKKGGNPWATSDEEDEEEQVEEEEEYHYEEEEEELVFKSDHEFSPESDVGEDDDVVPSRHARTAKQDKKGDLFEEGNCCKCGKGDHPEWILLCDKCDKGWHASCLRPQLWVIPEGEWFCPPCQHVMLIENLGKNLVEYEVLLKKRENEILRKQRLAYVGISLANVLPEKEAEVPVIEEEKDERTDREKRKQRRRILSDEELSDDFINDRDSDVSRSRSHSGSSVSEDEPMYRLRARRTKKAFNFKEYDDMINSAIRVDDDEEVGDLGKVEEDEDEDVEDEEKVNGEEAEEPDGVGGGKNEAYLKHLEEQAREDNETDEELLDEKERLRRKEKKNQRQRKTKRRINDLDEYSDEDEDSDDDFKASEAEDDEEENNEEGESDWSGDKMEEDSDDSIAKRARRKDRHGRGRLGRKEKYSDKGLVRRSTRKRRARISYDESDEEEEEDQNDKWQSDESEEEEAEESESNSESDDSSYGKKKKKAAPAVKPKLANFVIGAGSNTKGKGGVKRKRRKTDDDDVDKAWNSARGKKDKDEPIERRTRGRKINFKDILDSGESDDDGNVRPKRRPLSDSEDSRSPSCSRRLAEEIRAENARQAKEYEESQAKKVDTPVVKSMLEEAITAPPKDPVKAVIPEMFSVAKLTEGNPSKIEVPQELPAAPKGPVSPTMPKIAPPLPVTSNNVTFSHAIASPPHRPPHPSIPAILSQTSPLHHLTPPTSHLSANLESILSGKHIMPIPPPSTVTKSPPPLTVASKSTPPNLPPGVLPSNIPIGLPPGLPRGPLPLHISSGAPLVHGGPPPLALNLPLLSSAKTSGAAVGPPPVPVPVPIPGEKKSKSKGSRSSRGSKAEKQTPVPPPMTSPPELEAAKPARTPPLANALPAKSGKKKKDADRERGSPITVPNPTLLMGGPGGVLPELLGARSGPPIPAHSGSSSKKSKSSGNSSKATQQTTPPPISQNLTPSVPIDIDRVPNPALFQGNPGLRQPFHPMWGVRNPGPPPPGYGSPGSSNPGNLGKPPPMGSFPPQQGPHPRPGFSSPPPLRIPNPNTSPLQAFQHFKRDNPLGGPLYRLPPGPGQPGLPNILPPGMMSPHAGGPERFFGPPGGYPHPYGLLPPHSQAPPQAMFPYDYRPPEPPFKEEPVPPRTTASSIPTPVTTSSSPPPSASTTVPLASKDEGSAARDSEFGGLVSYFSSQQTDEDMDA